MNAIQFIRHPLKALLGERRVIIISHAGVKDFPLSAKLQWAACAASVGFIMWVSYSTGSFLAYRNLIESKDEQITTATREKEKLGQQYAMLKRDIKKINESTAGMDDYKEFVLNQYIGDDIQPPEAAAESVVALKPGTDPMMKRIEYLESQLKEAQESKKTLVEAIRTRTQGKIGEIEKIIERAGLEPGNLKKQASREAKFANNRTGSVRTRRNQGGPYIPITEEISSFSQEERTLFQEITELSLLNDIFSVLPLADPLPGAEVTSEFGRRTDPFTRRLARHSGVDLAGNVGAKIRATAPGEVTFSDRQGAYGRMVEIEHGLGISTRYGHLRTILVEEGQMVDAGDVIGIQGSSGRSSGPHLHYEVRYQDRAIDPMKFLKAKDDDL
ncbi:MAG: M23 family metallopeptidase [Alphaproteobacteria bacterium]|nr:M23 family metallopeptidase [Alphaproteobacteria bacterium]